MKLNQKKLPERELKQWLLESDLKTIASELDRAEPARCCRVFNLLPPEKAQRIFSYLEPVNQANLIEELEKKKALILLEGMEPDDRARLLEAFDEKTARRFLRLLSSKEQRATALLLRYAPETAGRIMSPFFMALQSDLSVEQALERIRAVGEEAETIYVLPVVDEHQFLQGVVDLEQLVMAKPNQTIDKLMHRHIKSFKVHDDQEEVARYIQSTDWLAVPVVEEDGRLLGIVTIDDAMEIMEQEDTEDMVRSGASGPLGRPYLTVPIFKLMQIRVVWLFMLALAGTLTVNVLSAFESTLNQVVVLALFIPLLIGIGGNSGSQSATTVVRALAVDDIRISDFFQVALRETFVGLLLGMTLGLVSYLVVWLIFQKNIALIVSLSLVTICTMATFTGAMMPILARLMRLDPAVVSAPFVSTLIDATGLLIYFMIARVILGPLVH